MLSMRLFVDDLKLVMITVVLGSIILIGAKDTDREIVGRKGVMNNYNRARLATGSVNTCRSPQYGTYARIVWIEEAISRNFGPGRFPNKRSVCMTLINLLHGFSINHYLNRSHAECSFHRKGHLRNAVMEQ